MLSLPATLTQNQERECLDRLTRDVQSEPEAQVVVNAAVRQLVASLAAAEKLQRETALVANALAYLIGNFAVVSGDQDAFLLDDD